MNSSPKRHHTVPKSYLDRFANPKGQIVMFDRSTGRKVTTSTLNVSVESRFYDVVDADGNRFTSVEEGMAELGGTASAAITTLIRRPYDLTADDRADLSLYIALQLARTPEFRRDTSETADFFMRMMLDLSLTGRTRDQVKRNMTEMSGEEPSEDLITSIMNMVENIEEFKIQQPQNDSIRMMLQMADELAPIVFDRCWTVLRSRKPFITSDQPVTLWVDSTEQNRMYGVGMLTADEVYFPLDPHHCLVLGEINTPELRGADTDRSRVKHINGAVAHRSRRWIYHRPKDSPLDELTISAHGPVLHINGVPVREGVNVWNTLRKGFLSGTEGPLIHFAHRAEGPSRPRGSSS